MSNTLLSPLEIEKRGQEIYHTKLKARLEAEHSGKFAVIDVESGEYFLGDTLDEALARARNKYQNKIFHTVKVGYEGIFKASGMGAPGNNYGWLFK